MTGIRDGRETYIEQVEVARQAVEAARPTSAAQQEQAGAWLAWLGGGLAGDGAIVTPGPADAPNT